MLLCHTCNNKINLFEKIFAKKCKDCDNTIHKKCSFIALDYNKYQEGIIEYIEPLCSSCADKNSVKYGTKRYCPTCGVDITVSKNQIKCEVCNQIGHLECFKIFAEKVDPSFIYPHLHPFNSHSYLCSKCYRELENKVSDIKSKAVENWYGGTRYEYLRGFKTIKNIGIVECNDIMLCSEPAAVEEKLKWRSIQLGANAFVKYHWDKKVDHYEETYIKGFSKNGNPYYGTNHYYSKWFVGYAEAVLVEKSTKRKVVPK